MDKSRTAHKVALQVATEKVESGFSAMDALECIYMNAFGSDATAVRNWKEARGVGQVSESMGASTLVSAVHSAHAAAI